MKNDKDLVTQLSITLEKEDITDSFPLMVIISLFIVVTVFHLFIIPNAQSFANYMLR